MLTYHLSPQELNFISRITNEQDGTFHAHSYCEIFYIRGGHIIHSLAGRKDPLKAGDAFLLFPGCGHKFIRKNSEPCSHRDIMIRESLLKEACDFLDPEFYETLRRNTFIRFQLGNTEIAFFEKLFGTFLSTDTTSKRKHFERIFVTELISYIYFQAQDSSLKYSEFKNRCLQEINNFFTFPDALQRIRAEMGYNSIYFARKFKQEFQTTPTAYLLSEKLNHAAFLLTTTSFSLDECCSAIGITSTTYFINAFKAKYGTTPTKYRKQQSAVSFSPDYKVHSAANIHLKKPHNS